MTPTMKKNDNIEKIIEEFAIELLGYCGASNSLVAQGHKPLPIDDLMKNLRTTLDKFEKEVRGEERGRVIEVMETHASNRKHYNGKLMSMIEYD